MKVYQQLTIIGCGMMGGSFALASRQIKLAQRIVGYSQHLPDCEQAKQLGIIDDYFSSITQAVKDADLVLIATPVTAVLHVLHTIKAHLRSGALVLDVGSTKQNIVEGLEASPSHFWSYFVPSHPIAGKEKAGVQAADPHLYQGKKVILTPTPNTDSSAISQATEVWEALGMIVKTMSAKKHDAIFAAVSHLPHLLAFAYMGSIAKQSHADLLMEMAGTGFRDFTRIAASQPDIWTDIFLTNHEQILHQCQALKKSLETFECAIKTNNTKDLKQAIAHASTTRINWEKPGQ